MLNQLRHLESSFTQTPGLDVPFLRGSCVGLVDRLPQLTCVTRFQLIGYVSWMGVPVGVVRVASSSGSSGRFS